MPQTFNIQPRLQPFVWLLPLIMTILVAACNGDPRPDEKTTGTHVQAQQTSVTSTPTAAVPSTVTAPPPSEAIPTFDTAVQAQRSDFVVPATTETLPPAPTLTATQVKTDTVSAQALNQAELGSALGSALGTVPPTGTIAVTCTYDALFVADVTIPDGTELDPGTPFTKTWRLQNSGTCQWENGVQMVFVEGTSMSGPTGVPVPPAPAGETVEIAVPLVAPRESGTHTGYWDLRGPDDHSLGAQVFVQIVVPAPTTSAVAPSTTAPPASGQLGTDRGDVPRLVLLNYFAWYDANGWEDCNISAGDAPLAPYGSDDPAAIARHVQMALSAGVDGFTLQWFGPGGRTDGNFETLLTQSQGTRLRSTVVFLRHIWPGAPITQATVAEALRYLVERYGSHPNFLTVKGKPVIFITDVYRVPRADGQTAQQAWAAIRAPVDPGRNTVWIAEGLDPSYLAVFDGLWVYKITHAAYPNAYLKAGQWAEAVRRWEAQTGQPKLWIGTLSPGWDDQRAGCKADVRVPSQAHRRERAGGAFYRATLDAAMASNPDWLWVNSFNEWVEGTYVEPSAAYGNLYLDLTREFAAQFKNQ